MHTPRWATTPTSGAGAAKHGGRFNRVGVPTLYLSATPPTAIAEYQQDALLMPPGMLVAYKVQLSAVADLSRGFHTGTWDPLWEDWNCDWRRLAIFTEMLDQNDVLSPYDPRGDLPMTQASWGIQTQ